MLTATLLGLYKGEKFIGEFRLKALRFIGDISVDQRDKLHCQLVAFGQHIENSRIQMFFLRLCKSAVICAQKLHYLRLNGFGAYRKQNFIEYGVAR